jgi:MFS transporter, ACS family, D-galactonate transporter
MKYEDTPRWVTVAIILIALSVFINYIDRGNLSTAAPIIKDEFHISATQLGILLTSFFVTYAFSNFVVGWLVDRFNVSWVLLVGYTAWSLTTALTGFAQTITGLLVLRLLLGVAESVAFPAYSKIFAKCLPHSRLGAANGAMLAGMNCGPAFGIFAGGLVMAAFGWRAFFMGFGIVSLLWLIPWLGLVHRELCKDGDRTHEEKGAQLPLILRERSLWGTSAGHFFGLYLFYFILTWIPYYLVHERHYSIANMAIIGGAAYLVMALTNVWSGWITDGLIRSGVSATLARKTLLSFGMVTAGTFALLCATSAPNVSILFLILAAGGIGLTAPQVWATVQTIAGTHAVGRWTGIQNGIGNMAGIVAPALTGVLADRTGNFILPFTIAAIMAYVSAFVWVFAVGAILPVDWSRARTPAGTPAGAPVRTR